MLRRLFLIILLVPIAELIVLVNVHRYLKPEIGAGNALLFIFTSIILTCIVGIRLAKIQGFRLLLQAQGGLQQGQLPNENLLEGLLIVVSGIALMIPGYISDIVGLLLLMPWIRRMLAKRLKGWLGHSLKMGHFQMHHQGRQQGWPGNMRPQTRASRGDIIDVDATDIRVPERPLLKPERFEGPKRNPQ